MHFVSRAAARPRRLIAVALPAVIALVLAVLGVFSPAASGAAVMPWRSGVMVSSANDANAWAGFRGRNVDVVSAYTYRSGGWDDLTNPDYVWKGLAGYKGLVVLNQPFWPENLYQPGSLATCAKGAFDLRWRSFGQNLVRSGHAITVIRLAWEANGVWFQWQASNTADWVNCFRHVAKAIRAGDGYAGIEWSMNSHASEYPETTHDQFGLYPGDDVVNIIGLTAYDEYPASHNLTQWNTQYHATGGLGELIRFATQHNKKISVPEWGVVSDPARQGGYDNPFYVQQMYGFFQRYKSQLFYEAYLSDPTVGNVQSSLNNPNQNPNSAAMYRKLWLAAK